MIPPIPASVCERRLEHLRRELAAAGLSSVVLSRPQYVRYATGIASQPSFLAMIDGRAWLVASESVDLGSVTALGIEVEGFMAYDPASFLDPQREAVAAMARLAARLPWPSVVGVETDHLPVGVGDALGVAGLADVVGVTAAWRARRDEHEIAAVRAAVRSVELALAAAAAMVVPDVTERDVFEAASRALRADAPGHIAMAGNLASGDRTSIADPEPTDRRLRDGDLVLVDLYPEVDGYIADLCRTWVVGQPSGTQRARHEAVESALAAAVGLMRPGVMGKEIDAVLRAELRDRVGSLERSMLHHGGHGVGLFAWERPWVGRGSEDVLADGSIVAIEPGLYQPDWGGIRIESDFLVTAAGVERLDSSSWSLTPGVS
jgi:Xaa-Pro aminopeptidase